jgi:hypothetical protein
MITLSCMCLLPPVLLSVICTRIALYYKLKSAAPKPGRCCNSKQQLVHGLQQMRLNPACVRLFSDCVQYGQLTYRTQIFQSLTLSLATSRVCSRLSHPIQPLAPFVGHEADPIGRHCLECIGRKASVEASHALLCTHHHHAIPSCFRARALLCAVFQSIKMSFKEQPPAAKSCGRRPIGRRTCVPPSACAA